MPQLIYDALKKDHDGLKPLLTQLVNAHQLDDEDRAALIAKIRDELIPHSRAEEAVFYNSLRTIDGAGGVVMHGYEEHMEAELMLRTLQAMDVVNADFTALAKKFKSVLEHHIAEEEDLIFATARSVLIDEEARLMAIAFEQMKPEIREGSFVQSTLDLVANLMPTRFAAPLRSLIHRP